MLTTKIVEELLTRVDVVLVGAAIWLFNMLRLKGEKSRVPDKLLPWVSLGIGLILAPVGHLAAGHGFETAQDWGLLAGAGVLYALMAVVIQSFGADLFKAMKGELLK